jgi:hypothetical protein
MVTVYEYNQRERALALRIPYSSVDRVIGGVESPKDFSYPIIESGSLVEKGSGIYRGGFYIA